MLRLIHRDVETVALHWTQVLQADPNNRYVHALLIRVGALNAHTLREVSVGSFFYGTILLIEGIGLWRGRRWAEYLTVIATASLIPLEIYEIGLHATITKGVVLLVNVVIVWYLAFVLRHSDRPRQKQ